MAENTNEEIHTTASNASKTFISQELEELSRYLGPRMSYITPKSGFFKKIQEDQNKIFLAAKSKLESNVKKRKATWAVPVATLHCIPLNNLDNALTLNSGPEADVEEKKTRTATFQKSDATDEENSSSRFESDSSSDSESVSWGNITKVSFGSNLSFVMGQDTSTNSGFDGQSCESPGPIVRNRSWKQPEPFTKHQSTDNLLLSVGSSPYIPSELQQKIDKLVFDINKPKALVDKQAGKKTC